jgi:membrane protein implicated in regulation of membrane protease activity
VETLFLACAVLGGAILVLQILLSLLGMDHGVDVLHLDLHSDGAEGLNLLGVRALSAGLTFFGIGGLAGYATPLGLAAALPLALLMGGGAAVGVAAAMRALLRMESDGTVRIERAVGEPAVVYLSIPGGRAGMGKVHLKLQDRLVEYQALSAHPLPTGAQVVVVDVVGPDTVEVIPSSDLGGLLDA